MKVCDLLLGICTCTHLNCNMGRHTWNRGDPRDLLYWGGFDSLLLYNVPCMYFRTLVICDICMYGCVLRSRLAEGISVSREQWLNEATSNGAQFILLYDLGLGITSPNVRPDLTVLILLNILPPLCLLTSWTLWSVWRECNKWWSCKRSSRQLECGRWIPCRPTRWVEHSPCSPRYSWMGRKSVQNIFKPYIGTGFVITVHLFRWCYEMRFLLSRSRRPVCLYI